MNLINGNREALLRPLQIVSGVVERRNSLPILANILIQKVGEDVSFIGTDIELQIRTSAKIGAGDSDAAVTVSGRKYLDILKSLPEAQQIDVAMAKSKLTVKGGKSRFTVQTLEASEFPIMAQATGDAQSFTMTQATLKRLLQRVEFSMATNDIRYYLNGLLLSVRDGVLTAVATDGHRLALSEMAAPEGMGNAEILLPRKTVSELVRLLEGQGDVEITYAAQQIKFKFDDIEITSKLLEGKFPDFTRVIPKNNKETFVIERDLLLRSLQRAAILCNDKAKSVKLDIEPGLMRISASNQDQEEAQEEIELDYGGANIEFGVNVSYMLDVLNKLGSDSVQLNLLDSLSSALLTVPGEDDFKYVVMPLRL